MIALKHKNTKAFSLFELMLSIGILLLLIAAGFIYTHDFRGRRLKKTTDHLVSYLNSNTLIAQSRGITIRLKINQVRGEIRPEQDRNNPDFDLRPFYFSPSILLSNVSFANLTSDSKTAIFWPNSNCSAGHIILRSGPNNCRITQNNRCLKKVECSL